MSSMEVNVDMLEQMDLMDMSDQEAVDVFLHSGGEENSAVSPVVAPDVDSFTSEISLKVPTQAELRHKLSSTSSTSTSQDTEAGGDEEEEEEEEAAAAAEEEDYHGDGEALVQEQGGGGHTGRRRPREVVVVAFGASERSERFGLRTLGN
ncbi:hypothetical protein CRUP_032927 [Coryphaenoides rupestris]|nr:hypothetical protein CRUP_032927 [Coryphaenoides rupestris]